jgi:hypothetical protein
MGAGGEEELLFYRPECFWVLAQWLRLAAESPELPGIELQAAAGRILPALGEFLERNRLAVVWDRLQRNHPSQSALLTAFHGWFDGLKTMKLIHHLSDGLFPRCEPDEALAELFARRGLEPVSGVGARLEQLRRLQNGADYSTPP